MLPARTLLRSLMGSRAVLSVPVAPLLRAFSAAAAAAEPNVFKSRYNVPMYNMSASEYVQEHFAKHGDRPALIDGTSGRTITYGKLLTQIGTVAAAFAARGVKQGTVVAIHAPNMPEYVVAFQALASLGARITTSNPLYTPAELCHQLKDSGASFVLTVPPFLEVAKAAAAMVPNGAVKDIFVVGTESGNFIFANDGKTQPPRPSIDPAKEILILPYSSGTTGLPKGVMLTHSNLVSNVQQCIGHPDFNIDMHPGDVVLGLLPAFHIYGLNLNLLSSMRQGCTVVTLPKFDPVQFLETVSKYKVSFAPLVPPIINFLARHPLVDKYDLSSLRVIFSGAAPLDGETQALVEKRFKGKVSCRQGYGMTECSPVAHFPHPKHVVPGSIGETVPNAECKIVHTDSGAALPAGKDQVGELCLRGPHVMVGYLNNPTATANTIDKDGWLHTGDIACRDETDNVFILDRLKELIKVKGFQVAPAELEGLLLAHPAIADAAVIGKPEERSGELPVAFVVAKPGVPAPSEADVKAYIAGKVAEYKQLAAVVFIDAVPKSASGKILRRVLKDRLKAEAAAAAK